MKNPKTFFTGLALVMTFVTVSVSAAYDPMDNGRMGNHMMGGQYNAGSTTGYQKEVQVIEAKYQKDLTTKEAAIRTKVAELNKAQADGSSTVAQLTTLRNELAGLEQDYWQLRNQVNREISTKIGSMYYGTSGWVPGYCSWHNNHNGYTMGRGMMHGQGMVGSGHMGGGYCGW